LEVTLRRSGLVVSGLVLQKTRAGACPVRLISTSPGELSFSVLYRPSPKLEKS
jgi:hypothetical protein